MKYHASLHRTFAKRIAPRIAVVGIAIALATDVSAQMDLPPGKGGFTKSMGIPSKVRKTVGVEMLGYRPKTESDMGALANFGLTRYLGHPVVGIAALGLEGYLGGHGSDLDGGGRAYYSIPSLLIGAGVDYNIRDEEADFILKLDIPGRRRGVVGGGSAVTLRWLPTRDQTFSIGISIPIGDPYAGKTRPQSDYVKVDPRRPERLEADELVGVDESLTESLVILRERVAWVARLTQPFADYGGGDARKAMQPRIAELRAHMDSTDALFPNGHTVSEEIRVYHETLDHAFSIALAGKPMRPGESTADGHEISALARGYLLDDVLFPYNSLFGQKKKTDSLFGMIAVAQTEFVKWLFSHEDITDEQARRIFFVYQTLCDAMEENRAELKERWDDNRHVWLPLQYGLRPEEHDTQEELNEIIGRATRQDFTVGNRLWYIMNEEFQFEMARSVRLAEDYHVLWIHDVSGYDHNKEPDAVAYEQVRNYFLALIERVNAYDDTGKLPVYMIFLDQHYFEANGSRLWVRLLEAPLDHDIDLPDEYADWEREIERLQGELRKAVEQSLILQLERSQFGEKWLKNRVKVHINITNPVDPSFYSLKTIGKMPIPDNNMRDHRKIIFYDITEEDPYRGMAMFTGMGIGEHYVGANWEDRAVMLQGPAAVSTKDAARHLLKTQGFEDHEIPYPLRPIPKPESYQKKVAEEVASLPGYVKSDIGILELHNETGFTSKPLNAAKCVLYSLMPPGSVLKVPDSLWQSYIYASLMAGSALRGCRVLVIAPTLASAPSSGGPQMARANGLMKRIVVFGNEMDDYMKDAGGILKVGLYAPRQDVGDIAGRFEQSAENNAPWKDRVYNFHPSLLAVERNVRAQLDSIGYSALYLEEKDSLETPKLHLKANFFASGAAWDGLMSQPEWAGILREYITYLARQQGDYDSDDDDARDVRDVPEALARMERAFFSEYLGRLPKEERDEMIIYLTIGSVNMDYRSQVMNGEVMIVLSGMKSLVGVIDFVLLAGLCEWMETPEEVDRLMPPPGWFMRGMAGFIKLAL
ncbi:MAG: hypothetical protein IH969_02300 [Candidatus Krumholzibacteriota bacterium]|nr:hypothetical protein [Candidatus Krumholzibacteriota bacterium]